jgi:hypothetical protein
VKGTQTDPMWDAELDEAPPLAAFAWPAIRPDFSGPLREIERVRQDHEAQLAVLRMKHLEAHLEAEATVRRLRELLDQMEGVLPLARRVESWLEKYPVDGTRALPESMP